MVKVLTSKDIAELAYKLVEEGEKRGITLRVMGAGCANFHLKEHHELWEKKFERKLTDIDLAGYDRQRAKIENLLQWVFGFEVLKPAVTPGLLVGRVIWWDASEDAPKMPSGHRLHGDIFLDRLAMNHVIEWKGRLHIDYPTIPLAEFMLEKLQIVGGPKFLGMGEKDAKDVILILLEHEVGKGDDEMVNIDVITKPLSKDWGFYYTATHNLKLLKERWLPKFSDLLTQEQRSTVEERIDKILDAIERTPKSFKWKMRARIGPKKIWYTPVEEVERMEGAVREEFE